MTDSTFRSHLLATCSRETAEAAAKALFNALPSLTAVPEGTRHRFINSVLLCADSVRSAAAAAAAQSFYDVLDLYSTLADLDPALATELEAASAVCVSVLDGSAALDGFEDVTDAPAPAPAAVVEMRLDAAVEHYFDRIATALGEGFILFSKDGSYFVGNDGLSPVCIAKAVQVAGFVRVFGSSLYYFNGLRFETIGVGTLAADLSAVSFSVCTVLASKLKHVATSNLDAWTKHVQETFTGSSAALDKKLAKIAELPCAVSVFFTKVAFIREVSSALLSNKDLYAPASELDGLATVDKLLARNGVVDLTRGTLSAPTSALPMSRVAGSIFDAHAKAPTFNSFLTEIFPDANTITYVQTVLGAYLRGKASRLQGALILQGAQGAGGPTVFLNAIKKEKAVWIAGLCRIEHYLTAVVCGVAMTTSYVLSLRTICNGKRSRAK